MARTIICLRYFLLVYVIFLGISGIIVTIGSGIFLYHLKQYYPLTPENVTGPAIVLVVVGLLTGLVGWAGWHVLDSTHTFQIMSFTVTLAALAMIQTGAGIWALIRHEQIDSLRTTAIESAFALSVTEEKGLWDRMQIRLSCCGIDGPADYRFMDSVPWSCCDTSSLASPSTASAACSTLYVRGCLQPVINRTRSTLIYIFLLAISSVIVQVCGVVASCFLVRNVQKNAAKRRREILSGLPRRMSVARPLPPDPPAADSRLHRQSYQSH